MKAFWNAFRGILGVRIGRELSSPNPTSLSTPARPFSYQGLMYSLGEARNERKDIWEADVSLKVFGYKLQKTQLHQSARKTVGYLISLFYSLLLTLDLGSQIISLRPRVPFSSS